AAAPGSGPSLLPRTLDRSAPISTAIREVTLHAEGHANAPAGRALDGRTGKAAADIDTRRGPNGDGARKALFAAIGREVERNRDSAVRHDHRAAHRHRCGDPTVGLTKPASGVEFEQIDAVIK